VAGNGTGAYFGDGGAATAAGLFQPNGVDVASDGTIFIADQHDDRVRAVAPDGTISTVAGTGLNGYSGDGGAATAAMLNFPSDVAVLADGSLLIVDQKNHRVRSLAGAIPPPPAEATGTGTQTPSRDGTTTPTARHEDGAHRATTTDAASSPAPPPAYGRTVVADVTRGTVSVRLPGVEHAVAVADVRAIPSGSVVDTRRGR
jgi:hypothetical protein